MKYFTLLAFVTLVPAALGAVAEDAKFAKRDSCTNDNDCLCPAGKEGLFCGDGVFGCIPGHVYQCGEGGTISCDFGPRDSCAQCGAPQCPP